MTLVVSGAVQSRAAAELIGSIPTDLWVGGRQTAPHSGGRFDVVDPASELVLTQVADASAAEAMRALDLASRVQPTWAATPLEQ